MLREDDTYYLDGEAYCHNCYDDERGKNDIVHEYSYKPEPIFYGEGNRYFGIELEIDGAGKDNDYAEELLDIGNIRNELLYIKTDSSLDEGLELVSHPCTLDYHKNIFPWEDIMHCAIHQGYRSHQTSTCGLHLHVNRTAFSENRYEQDEIISRILYFVEHHWNELLKFSRRSEYSMNRWAARYGYEHMPKAIMDKAKKGGNGRYAAVNLCNYHTVEFRLFRGTLKYNTFIATIQLVNRICDAAIYNTDDSISKLSWSDFVADITEPELIQYLKETYTSMTGLKKRRNINMCALFGWLDYKGITPQKALKKLTQALANAAEERGTYASGIAYVKDGKATIFKHPKSAHKIHFNIPNGTKAVMGHTHMTTQGNEKFNYNNHPFYGHAGIDFAFAHNGVLHNDRELRKEKKSATNQNRNRFICCSSAY